MKNRFKIAREYLEITQTDVAEAIGLSRNSISKMESDKVEKPNVHYTNYLRKKGINQDWLLYEKGEMLSNENISNNEDYEEIKKENSYLRNKIERMEQRMEEQRINFLQMIHDISGKPLEHKKKAANPNEKEKNSFVLGLSYVPAFT